jgi:integrase
MRRGEILAVKRQHIDFPKRLLLIPLTKNGHARTIPLSREAITILETTDGGGCIFPIKRDALRLAWARIMNRAKIDDLRFHDLRHEAISRFFEMGLSMPEVASISGHRDARMLLRYAYAEKQNIIRKLDHYESV